MSAEDNIRTAVQAALDTAGDGWSLGQIVICMGIERYYDGEFQSAAWVWAPRNQPEWMTDGLLRAAEDLRMGCDAESD